MGTYSSIQIDADPVPISSAEEEMTLFEEGTFVDAPQFNLIAQLACCSFPSFGAMDTKIGIRAAVKKNPSLRCVLHPSLDGFGLNLMSSNGFSHRSLWSCPLSHGFEKSFLALCALTLSQLIDQRISTAEQAQFQERFQLACRHLADILMRQLVEQQLRWMLETTAQRERDRQIEKRKIASEQIKKEEERKQELRLTIQHVEEPKRQRHRLAIQKEEALKTADQCHRKKTG
jgi:hypothetical protein